jgi:hypothetical protein
MEGDQVGLLTRVKFRLLAAQPALGLGDPHALSSAQPDEIGLDYVDNTHVSSTSDGRGKVRQGAFDLRPVENLDISNHALYHVEVDNALFGRQRVVR